MAELLLQRVSSSPQKHKATPFENGAERQGKDTASLFCVFFCKEIARSLER